MTAPKNAISARGLKKTYKGQHGKPSKEALKSIDLDIPRGSIFGLLGPNGAGKSTFINILAGLVMKTEGDVSIWGYDIETESRQSRCAIGIVPQELNVDAFFTPTEALEMQAGLYGVPKSERRTMELIKAVDLLDKKDAYSRSLSGGMKRRLMVAKAMVHNPPVLVLDEPTAGVDVELRQALWKQIKELNAQGVTIVLTTHYLEEAQELCDQIAIINHGELVACADKSELISTLDQKTLHLTFSETLTETPDCLSKYQPRLTGTDMVSIDYRPSQVNICDILDQIQQSDLCLKDISTVESDLEDVFIQLTQDKVA